MNCYCGVFILNKKKYFTQCKNCVNIPFDNTKNISNTIKYGWFDKPVLIIRDYPHLRIVIELYLLFGYVFWIFIGYTAHHKIINYSSYKYINTIIKFILGLYVIILLSYIIIFEKIKKEIRYKIKKD